MSTMETYYQGVNSICQSYLISNRLWVDWIYVGLYECSEGLATLDELCEGLIRCKESVIECWEEKCLPRGILSEIRKVDNPNLVTA